MFASLENITLAIAPAIAACALVGVYLTRLPGLPRWMATLHAAPAIALVLLLVLVAWALMGRVEANLLHVVACSIVLFVAPTLTHLRDSISLAISRASLAQPLRAARDGIALAIGIVCSFLALELPWNDKVAELRLLPAGVELGIIALVIVGLYFLGQRRGTLPAVGAGALAFIGIAQYFIMRFKNTAILPSDLYALGTAAAVGGAYSYPIANSLLRGVAAACIGMSSLAMIRPLPEPERPAAHIRVESRHQQALDLKRLASGAAVNVWVGLACIAGIVLAVTLPNYRSALGIRTSYWAALDSYRSQGFLPSFISSAQELPLKAPRGYKEEEAQQLQAELAAQWAADAERKARYDEARAQFADEQPCVIAVMNEAFSDLSCLEGLRADYEGPEYFCRGMDDALLRGQLAVGVLGGGTCNSEFEFLCGVSTAFVGAGKYPYTMYRLSDVDSLAHTLADLGYGTWAMHPNYATNWNRSVTYRWLGFEHFLSIEDFEGAEVFHNGVSDAATYDAVLRILEENEGPQFIFDVTMQNHSAYDIGNLPEGSLPNLAPAGIYDEHLLTEINEYIGCIEESDRALEEFVTKLSQLDRKVVLVFFGDHQPSFSLDLANAFWPTEPDVDRVQRIYHSDYVIWANYDVAGAEKGVVDDASAEALAAMVGELVGMPLSESQQARLALRDDLPALNLLGIQDSKRVWHAIESSGARTLNQSGVEVDPVEQAARDAYDKLSRIEYMNFGSQFS